jgi:Mrp family chromosome partitioning ATPase
VIVHRAVAPSVQATRTRRHADEGVPAVLQSTDTAWPLLHLTLSRIGDVAHAVEVVANQPLLSGAVALNLAAVAAHESRATVVIDTDTRSRGLALLLPASALTTASRTDPMRDPQHHSQWDAPRLLNIGRDTFIDLVLPRRIRSRQTGGDAVTSTATSHEANLLLAELPALAAHHDLAVYLTDPDRQEPLPLEADVVLCVQPGVTTMAWLSRMMRELEGRGRRLRAVVLWSADLPVAA